MNNFEDSQSPNDEGGFDPRKFNPAEFQEFMKKYLEDPESFDTQELAKAAGIPTDPQQLKQMLEMISQAMGPQTTTGGVDWDAAIAQAKAGARRNNRGITESERDAWREAVHIGGMWLNEATDVSELSSEPKLLTRDLWVDDAMPLFKAMSQPVADRMASALSDHIASNAPEEMSGLMAEAGRLLRNAGGAMFAMQLGQAIGRLSEQVLSGSDIGLPIFTEQRAAFLPQNLEVFIRELEVPAQEAQIYLAVRELAHARLFKHSRWLREAVVAQISAYAAQITIDQDKIMGAVADTDPTDAEGMRKLLESGAMIGEKTEDQERALEAIETLLALIEGWVDAVTLDATKLLPNAQRIAEAIHRRRVTGGPAELTFGTLVGLQLRPRKLREASSMWQLIGNALGNARRDSLWDHPDMLPNAADIADPATLIGRLQGGNDDDFDSALRDLLGE